MSMEDYCTYMAKDNSPTDAVTLNVLAHVLKRDILMVTNACPGQGEKYFWVIANDSYQQYEPILLGNIMDWYQCLQKTGEQFTKQTVWMAETRDWYSLICSS